MVQDTPETDRGLNCGCRDEQEQGPVCLVDQSGTITASGERTADRLVKQIDKPKTLFQV